MMNYDEHAKLEMIRDSLGTVYGYALDLTHNENMSADDYAGVIELLDKTLENISKYSYRLRLLNAKLRLMRDKSMGKDIDKEIEEYLDL